MTPPVIPAPSDNADNACVRLLRAERYLARQAKAAHNLGVGMLEHYYLASYLALKLWRMERFEANLEDTCRNKR